MSAKTFKEWVKTESAKCRGIESTSVGQIIWNAAIKSIEENGNVQQHPLNAFCHWTFDVDTCSYDTECGEKWVFPEGSAKENGLVFCPICGRIASVQNHDENI